MQTIPYHLVGEREATMQDMITKGEQLREENKEDKRSVDWASALQTYFNRILVSSLPGINSSPVLELKAGDSVKDAIQLLYEKHASVALITDLTSDNSSTDNAGTANLFDHYIGVVNFATMVLWCFERLQKDDSYESKKEAQNQPSKGFFSMLEQNPHIRQTKVGELAKSFLWDPFFPVHLEDDTLFHVLLLMSKHPIHVVPVIEQSKHQVFGFITQNAVLKLLLQSSGLEWFDSMANATLSEFRFRSRDRAFQVYADHSISEVFSVLSENRTGAVAVVDRNTKELVGAVRIGDIFLLLDNDELFANTKTTSVAQFMKVNVNKDNHCQINQNEKQDSLARNVWTKGNFIPRMDSPVIHRETNTLKQIMERIAETNSESSFLVDGSCQVTGMLTLRDIIMEFAPPCMDSRIDGGGFFESALQQTGCHIENGTMICDH